jgi:stage II sporulation protein D
MSRPALRLGAACLLLLAGVASSLAATRSPAVRVSATTTGTTATTVTSPAKVVLAVSGHGWGHGLGMSQWGAYGYAKHGWTYEQILAHYYSGTTLGPAPVSAVRVLLAQSKKATITSATPWTVIDSTGAKLELEPSTVTLKPTLILPGKGKKLSPPFTFVGKQPLLVGDKQYRGKIEVSTDGKQLEVIDTVGLEAYVKGVVASEVPPKWPAEVLKAQAVAARSYALANLAKKRDFDLYADTRSQVYGGVAAESQSTNDAITATKGQVVLWHGKVADTLFFSTSGGRTASAEEATGTAVPYLVSVADPYDTTSPVHDWGPVLYDGAKVAEQLKISAPLADLTISTGPSGRATSVTAVSADDSQATVTSAQFRALLELRSIWFTTALLSLQPQAKTISYGGSLSLTGFARGADSVTLESKSAAHDWAPAGELILDADGSFATVVKPVAATQYRLSWRTARAGLVSAAVAARVDAQPAPTGVQGTERPVVPGAPVQLQQQAGTAWTTLSATTADAAGAWTFSGALQPGTYRVRCAPGKGLAAGVSATFQAP